MEFIVIGKPCTGVGPGCRLATHLAGRWEYTRNRYIRKMDLEMGEGEWETSTDNQGNLVLTRTTADWTSYTQKADRLPLRIENRNYLILESAFIYGEDYSADQKGLYYQIAIVPDAQLSIKLPGFIRAHTADSIIDSQEAVWQLSRLDEMATGELLLKATVFHGLVVVLFW